MNKLLFYRTVSLLTKVLSRPAAYEIARPFSALAYTHNHAEREALAANLRVVLDGRGKAWTEPELEAMARKTFDNFGKYIIDFFKMGRVAPDVLEAILQVQHFEYLEQCRKMAGGIIGLTAHIGNWELGANALEASRCKINAIALRQSSSRLDNLFQARRSRRGVRVLPVHDAASAAQACLKRKEIVVLLADLPFSDQKRCTRFFGRPAPLPRAPAILAARSGAPILPGFVLRQPDDTFRCRFYPPIMPGSHSVDEIQEHIRAVLEEVIGDHPDQWFAFKPLWQD